MKEKLIKNSFWSYAAKLAATLLFFAADIVIARNLNIDQYAEWAFFFSILNMIYYVYWFGINQSAKIFVSKTMEHTEERRDCIRAGINVRWIATLILALLSVLLVCLMPAFPFFSGLAQKYPHLHTLLFIAVGIAGINSFTELFKEIEIGTQHYRNVFILTALEYGTILIACCVSAGRPAGTEGIGFGYLAAYALVFILGMLLIRKWNGIRAFRNGSGDRGLYARKIFRYALPLALIGIGGIVLVEMDTLMLGVLSGPEDVSDYAIAKQICTKASHINNALAAGTLTAFSVIPAADYPKMRASFKRLAWINAAVTLAAGGALFILARFLIGFLYGDQYEKAADIIRFLVPFYILYGISAFYALFLDFHGGAGKRSLWYLIMVVINFVLNLLLIPRYGTEGACMATVISLIPYTLYLLYAAYMNVWKEMREAHENA